MSKLLEVVRRWLPPLVGRPPAIGPANQVTLWVIVGLVAMRLVVGYHFFKEGSTKIQGGDFSSVGFLRSATGPLAPLYHSLLKDEDGLLRLNFDPARNGRDRINVERTLAVWSVYRQDVADWYGFDQQQRKQAEAVQRRHEQQLRAFFADFREEINEYFNGIERRDAYAADPARRDLAGLRQQLGMIRRQLRAKSAPWLAEIDVMWKLYQDELNDVATPEQRQGRRPLELKLPGEARALMPVVASDGSIGVRRSWKLIDTDFVDRFIPALDLLLGSLLLLGLLTRLTSMVAALFLLSIVLSQWPGSVGAAPVYYQSVEMMSLLVLAATSAGCFAGLDFFLVHWQRCWGHLKPLWARVKDQIQQPAAREARNEPNA